MDIAGITSALAGYVSANPAVAAVGAALVASFFDLFTGVAAAYRRRAFDARRLNDWAHDKFVPILTVGLTALVFGPIALIPLASFTVSEVASITANIREIMAGPDPVVVPLVR